MIDHFKFNIKKQFQRISLLKFVGQSHKVFFIWNGMLSYSSHFSNYYIFRSSLSNTILETCIWKKPTNHLNCDSNHHQGVLTFLKLKCWSFIDQQMIISNEMKCFFQKGGLFSTAGVENLIPTKCCVWGNIVLIRIVNKTAVNSSIQIASKRHKAVVVLQNKKGTIFLKNFSKKRNLNIPKRFRIKIIATL